MLHQNEGTNQESGRLEIQETGDLTHERSKGNPQDRDDCFLPDSTIKMEP